jgi:CheY-like chemotaxis protein
VTLSLLLVEDSRTDALLVKSILKKDRFQVVVAGDLQTAEARLNESDFHIVLSDLNLPDAEGQQIIRQIRLCAPNTALVCYSGRPPRSSLLGVDAFLLKDVLDAGLFNWTAERAYLNRLSLRVSAKLAADRESPLVSAVVDENGSILSSSSTHISFLGPIEGIDELSFFPSFSEIKEQLALASEALGLLTCEKGVIGALWYRDPAGYRYLLVE